MKPLVKIKRVYEKPLKADGYRVFVDRLWPRGIRKDSLAMNEWAKDLAPSVTLRKWFGHEPQLWEGFKKQYLSELKRNRWVELFISDHKKESLITLLYAAADMQHNHALILQQFLEQKFEDATN